MSTNTAPTLLSLPLEILDEILKRMDLNSIKNMAETSKFFKDKVESFRLAYPDLWRIKIVEQRAYIHDEDDYDNDSNPDPLGGCSEYEPADDIEALIESFNYQDFDIERGEWEDDEEEDY